MTTRVLLTFADEDAARSFVDAQRSTQHLFPTRRDLWNVDAEVRVVIETWPDRPEPSPDASWVTFEDLRGGG